jgi:hypothetical protein
VILVATERGGHLGWLTISLNNWLNPTIKEFIEVIELKEDLYKLSSETSSVIDFIPIQAVLTMTTTK